MCRASEEVSGFCQWGMNSFFCATGFVEIFGCTAVDTESSLDCQRADALLLNCVFVLLTVE